MELTPAGPAGRPETQIASTVSVRTTAVEWTFSTSALWTRSFHMMGSFHVWGEIIPCDGSRPMPRGISAASPLPTAPPVIASGNPVPTGHPKMSPDIIWWAKLPPAQNHWSTYYSPKTPLLVVSCYGDKYGEMKRELHSLMIPHSLLNETKWQGKECAQETSREQSIAWCFAAKFTCV